MRAGAAGTTKAFLGWGLAHEMVLEVPAQRLVRPAPRHEAVAGGAAHRLVAVHAVEHDAALRQRPQSGAQTALELWAGAVARTDELLVVAERGKATFERACRALAKKAGVPEAACSASASGPR